MRSAIIAAIGIAAGCTPAFADEQFCQVQSQIAGRLMEARQSGVPMARMMAINAEMGGPAAEQALYDEMTIRAYEAPLFPTDARKAEIETEFSNQIMIACLRGAAG